MIFTSNKKGKFHDKLKKISSIPINAICAEDIFGLHNDGIKLFQIYSLEIFSSSHDPTTNSKLVFLESSQIIYLINQVVLTNKSATNKINLGNFLKQNLEFVVGFDEQFLLDLLLKVS